MKKQDLLKAVKLEVEARKTSEGVKAQAMKLKGSHGQNFPPVNDQNPPATSDLMVSDVKVKSVYCWEDNYSASCTKVISTSECKSTFLPQGDVSTVSTWIIRPSNVKLTRFAGFVSGNIITISAISPKQEILSSQAVNQGDKTTANTMSNVKNWRPRLWQLEI